jgi:hypothetical protein
VFGHISRKGLNAGASGAGGRRFCTALAVLGLYVQLLAAGLCTTSSPADALANRGAFPICHTQETGGSPPAQDQTHHDCPFCALHCKAAMVPPPSIGTPERFVDVATHAELPIFIVPARARFSLGAPPRGPPASA